MAHEIFFETVKRCPLSMSIALRATQQRAARRRRNHTHYWGPETGQPAPRRTYSLPAMKRVRVNVDGGARGNPGPAAIAAVATDPDGEVLAERSEAIGDATNNVAEYRAM